MKKNLLTVLVLFLVTQANAQEKILAKIQYHFTHINDTTKPAIPIVDETVSYLAKDSYYFKSISDELLKRQVDDQRALAIYDNTITIKISTTPSLQHYIIHPGAEKTTLVEGISSTFDSYVLDDVYEKQDWNIGAEEKEIGGYLCQKATTRFKGRVYTAWFTNELPFPYGPWKLHGLPGLILSAVDESGTIAFEYAGFDKMEETAYINPPEYALKSNKRDLAKLKKVFKDDPAGYYRTLATAGKMEIGSAYYGIDYQKTSVFFDSNDYKPSTETNNPIELDVQ